MPMTQRWLASRSPHRPRPRDRVAALIQSFPNRWRLEMRKIRIIEQISLDGVIQAPGGRDEDGDYAHGGWAMPYFDTAMGEAIATAQGRSFDLLRARRTYDIFAGYWPKVENGPIADGLNAATKYVATHRPDSLGWGPVKDLGGELID